MRTALLAMFLLAPAGQPPPPAWPTCAPLPASTPRPSDGRYHPLNLLDEDPAPCGARATGPGRERSVTIYFKKKQRIDRLLSCRPTRAGRLVREGQGERRPDASPSIWPTAPSSRRCRPLEGSTTRSPSSASAGPTRRATKRRRRLPRRRGALTSQAALSVRRWTEAALRRQARQAPRRLERRAHGAPTRAGCLALRRHLGWSYKPLLGASPREQRRVPFPRQPAAHAPGRGRALERHAVEVERVRVDKTRSARRPATTTGSS